MLSVPDTRAFSPGGPIGNGTPGDSWQTPVIGYGLGGDLNAPKNLGEEYRRNTPVVYYTYDANFLDYFGSNGVVAVDDAMAILNTLTNVDSYSTSLSEFSLETRHQNYQAQALGLFDLKSYTLGAMMEQLGLADPVRYNWTLHDRRHIDNTPACPVGMEYLVVQRNFDFVSTPLNQLQYSPYVNDTLYSYQIFEACTGPNPLALAEPFSVDPLADIYSPVASGAVFWGDYYTGITRDDIAGLRYLLSTNNMNLETPAGDLVVTNLSGTIPLTTSNLSELLLTAQTNNPGTNGTFGSLNAGFFPNVTVVSFSNYWTTVTNWEFGSYLYSPPGSPAGTQILVVYSNIVSIAPLENFADVFGNVITNGNLTNFPGLINGGTITLGYSTNTKAFLMNTYVTNFIGAPAGFPPYPTNTLKAVTFTNQPSGEYFTLPTGDCGLEIEDPQPPGYPIPNVIRTTNVITSATNSVTATNGIPGFVASQSIVTVFTNHTYIVRPIICSNQPPTPALYQGVGNIKFVRADYDSLLGQYWQPVTNNYTMVMVTNSRAVTVRFQRIVTQPDFLFSAQDNTSPNVPGPTFGAGVFVRNLNFDQANVLQNLAGPGTITPSTTISFDKVGPVYYNTFGDVMDGTPYFNETPGGDLSDLFYTTYFIWASYDGTTNAPVVYPNGTSIDNLASQILIHLSPISPLPSGFVDVDYTPNAVQFIATGGAFTQPYIWTASGLPTGLTLSSDGKLSGIPTQLGTFDFILTLTDYVGRSVQWSYTIMIQP